MITNIELDLYFTVMWSSAKKLNEIIASLQMLLSRNEQCDDDTDENDGVGGQYECLPCYAGDIKRLFGLSVSQSFSTGPLARLHVWLLAELFAWPTANDSQQFRFWWDCVETLPLVYAFTALYPMAWHI